MSGFQLTFYEVGDPLSRGRYCQLTNEKMQERIRKSAQYLGPWCPDCGKRGTKCRKRSSCFDRKLKRVFQGCDLKAMRGLSLPRPSNAWISDKYGSRSTEYQSGGRTKQGARVHIPNYVDRQDAATEYAYDLATGRWSEDREAVAA